MDADLNKLKSKLAAAEARLGSFDKKAKGISVGIGALASLGLLAVGFSKATSKAIEFDDIMRKATARAEGTSAELVLLSDAAL
jgi:hypothetical protein